MSDDDNNEGLTYSGTVEPNDETLRMEVHLSAPATELLAALTRVGRHKHLPFAKKAAHHTRWAGGAAVVTFLIGVSNLWVANGASLSLWVAGACFVFAAVSAAVAVLAWSTCCQHIGSMNTLRSIIEGVDEAHSHVLREYGRAMHEELRRAGTGPDYAQSPADAEQAGAVTKH